MTVPSCFPVYLLMDDSGNINGAYLDIQDAYQNQTYGVDNVVATTVHGEIPVAPRLVYTDDTAFRQARVTRPTSDDDLKSEIWKAIQCWYATQPDKDFVDSDDLINTFNEKFSDEKNQMKLTDLSQGGDR